MEREHIAFVLIATVILLTLGRLFYVRYRSAAMTRRRRMLGMESGVRGSRWAGYYIDHNGRSKT